MPFHKVTYHDQYRFATLHNYGCTFRCPVCSYKLRNGAKGRPGRIHPKPERFLTVEEIKRALRSVPVEKVFFMGGEPSLAAELPELLAFAKGELGVETRLGHTNGSDLPLANLDGANVGLKAWDEEVHRRYTGWEKRRIYDNVAAAFAAGLDLRANVVYVPGLVDADQVEAIAAWLATLSGEIPFHVMGYIPVPGQPYRSPTAEQLDEVVAACRRHLRMVQCSQLTSEQALDLGARDDRFAVRQIA